MERKTLRLVTTDNNAKSSRCAIDNKTGIINKSHYEQSLLLLVENWITLDSASVTYSLDLELVDLIMNTGDYDLSTTFPCHVIIMRGGGSVRKFGLIRLANRW